MAPAVSHCCLRAARRCHHGDCRLRRPHRRHRCRAAPRLPALPALGGGRVECDGGGRAVTVRGRGRDGLGGTWVSAIGEGERAGWGGSLGQRVPRRADHPTLAPLPSDMYLNNSAIKHSAISIHGKEYQENSRESLCMRIVSSLPERLLHLRVKQDACSLDFSCLKFIAISVAGRGEGVGGARIAPPAPWRFVVASGGVGPVEADGGTRIGGSFCAGECFCFWDCSGSPEGRGSI